MEPKEYELYIYIYTYIYISSNNVRHPVIKTYTTFTTLHSTSLHMSTLHFLSFKLDPNTLHHPLI